MTHYAVVGYGLTGAFAVQELLSQDWHLDDQITVFDTCAEHRHPAGGSQGASRIFRTNTAENEGMKKMAVDSLRHYRCLEGAITSTATLILGNYWSKINAARDHASARLPDDRYTLINDTSALTERYPFLNAKALQGVEEKGFENTKDGIGSGIINPDATIRELRKIAEDSGVNFHFASRIIAIETQLQLFLASATRHADNPKLSWVNTVMDDKADQCLKDETRFVQGLSSQDSSHSSPIVHQLIVDKLVIATGPWTPELCQTGRLHSVISTMRPKIAALYFFKILQTFQQYSVIQTFPAIMLKLQGSPDFALHHPEWVSTYPEFQKPAHLLECYLMKETLEDESIAIKVGLFAPSNAEYQPIDDLLQQADTHPELERLAANVLWHFLPGLRTLSPAIGCLQPDFVLHAPIDEMPQDRMIIDCLTENCVVAAGLSGLGAKLAPAIAKEAVQKLRGPHTPMRP